jgi:hypothetical protein
VAAVVGEGAPPPMLDGALCPICCGEVHPRPEAEVAVVQVHLVAVGGCGAGVKFVCASLPELWDATQSMQEWHARVACAKMSPRYT